MTFCSQLDPQTSTWFDHSAEDSSRTVSYLVRRLRPVLYVVSHPGDPAVPFSSTFSRRLLFSNFAIQTLLCTRFPEFNNVELHRPTVRSPVQTNSFQHSSKAVRPSPCPSTMSNSIDTSRSRYATVFQSSTMSSSIDQLYELPSAMSNSIDVTMVLPVNNVELHRQVVLPSSWCLRSTMSNSIDYPS